MSHSFKQITPTDHFGWHAAYLEVYERLFHALRWEQTVEGTQYPAEGNLLEIGTDGGGGLEMYADYFPNFKIYGIDINPTPGHLKENPRITHYVQDAYSTLPTNIFGNTNFDIIIDDGPHTLDSLKLFCHLYPQLLTADGIAIIEDIQKPEYIQQLGACVPEGFIGYGIDLRHVNGRYDDILFVIQRK